MTTKNNLFLFAVLTICFISHQQIFSQEIVDIDSLKNGKSYKIVLFDDRELIGQIISSDSLSIRLKDNNNIYRIKKDDILKISNEIQRTVPFLILNVNGGYSIVAGNYRSYSSSSVQIKGFNLGVEGILPLSEYRAIRLGLDYSGLKKPGYTDTYYYLENSGSYTKEEESNIRLISFRTDYLFGDFRSSKKFMYFFSAGAGVNFYHESAYSSYSVHNDTIYYMSQNGERNSTSMIFAIGLYAGYKISNKMGIQGQIEYNLIANEHIFDHLDGGFFPFKLGFFYIF
jgi:hypothetical protein